MKPLTASQKDEIADFDFEHYRRSGAAKPGEAPNRNRFYIYLTMDGDNVEVRHCAVKQRATGEPVVKEVIRASVDSTRMYAKDVAFGMMCGYVVDWSPEGVGRKRSWSYRGKWEREDYTHKNGKWKLHAPVVNPEILAETERFKWCAWTSGCGHILDYLKHYVERPRIELLAKAGIGHLALLRGFMKTLEADKKLMSFVSRNLAEIHKKRYNATEILRAARHNITLEQSRTELETIARFNGEGIPRTVNKLRAYAYICKQGASVPRYSHYIELCVHYKLDLRDTKNAYPKDFEGRMRDLQDRYDAEKRKEDAKRRREEKKEEAARMIRIDSAIAKVAATLAKIEKASGPFAVRLPRADADLHKEGKKLGHCVWAYGNRVERGECIIVFVRMPDKPNLPFVTVDFNPADGKVKQCYGAKNQKPPQNVLDFVYGPLQKQLKKLQKAS